MSSIQTILAIPFDNYSTDAKGHIVGERRRDVTTGKEYMFVQAGQSLTNSALAANEALSLKSATTFEVTNDVSTSLDASYPWSMGRANSACPQSTASVTYYCWTQIGGIGVYKTDAGDDIVKGELVACDETVDGAVDRIADNTTITDRILRTVAGRALADDVDAADTVSCMVKPLWL